MVPLIHSSEKKALRAARMAVKSLAGLRGYVGVDMVLTRKEPVVMEINPRLTTSYIGLRRVVNFNPAQAIIDAVLKRRLPENVQCSGYAFFLKVKVPTPTRKTLSKTYGLKEVISPPFPAPGNGTAHALLVSYSARLKDAKIRLYKAEKRLWDVLSQG
jgi:biotin carboxylase